MNNWFGHFMRGIGAVLIIVVLIVGMTFTYRFLNGYPLVGPQPNIGISTSMNGSGMIQRNTRHGDPRETEGPTVTIDGVRYRVEGSGNKNAASLAGRVGIDEKVTTLTIKGVQVQVRYVIIKNDTGHQVPLKCSPSEDPVKDFRLGDENSQWIQMPDPREPAKMNWLMLVAGN